MKKPKKGMWDLPTTIKGSYDSYYKDNDYKDLIKPTYNPKDYWGYEEKASLEKNMYGDWAYEATDRYNPSSTDIQRTRVTDVEEVRARWAGSLVQFVAPYYPRGLSTESWASLTTFPNLSVTSPMAEHNPNTSRKVHGDHEAASCMGTVIKVDSQPGYRDQWCVSILWSDSMISYENILDLEIIQPGPG